jgi:hypothetical protein
VNSTPGLEDRGAITAIVDITPLAGGDWLYRMRPVLRQALEDEGLA